ncbi:MAG: HAD-IIA family hydrolase [Chloroflexota bacterium]|nr:HAD-IIA family hydrolase [Chloroflexota bacterium]
MDGLPPVIRLVIFDLDGVIYRGERAIDGAVKLVADLKASGMAVRFATNNSTVDRLAYVARLGRHGIRATPEEVVTSTSATIEHLARNTPEVRRVLAVGGRGIIDEFVAAGYQTVSAADAVPEDYDGGGLDRRYDALVVGLDPSFDYQRLAAAVSAVRAGALFVATNADALFPTGHGFLPGAGAMVAAIAAGGGVEPEVIGKPQPAMFIAALESSGVAPDEAVVVGDNPESDVVAARRAGIRSILVLTGVADAQSAATLAGERRPDAILAGPDEVRELLLGSLS